jgi:hypothetical protein
MIFKKVRLKPYDRKQIRAALAARAQRQLVAAASRAFAALPVSATVH